MKKQIFVILLCLACGLFSCTQTDSGTTAKELTPNEIAEEIHTISRSGLCGNSEKLMKYVNMIDSNNVVQVVNIFFDTYDCKSVFSAVMRNRFISSDTRAKAVKHIKDMLMQQAKRYGVYTEDYDKLLDGHIDYEKNKSGRMSSRDIDQDMITFAYRFTQTANCPNTLSPANGKIDDSFNQGHVGDCWLLSAIKSLSINPKGLEMLNDLISLDNQGNVTVQLKGVKRVYTISKEELEGANEFAQGDLDIRAIELAVNKYLHEMEDHKNKLDKIKDAINSGATICFDVSEGMPHLSTAYYILFGIEYCLDEKPSNETIENLKIGSYSTLVSSYNKYCMEGYDKHHVYAVTGADSNYIYLSNPHHPDTNLTMTHDNFIKFFNQSYSMKY